MILRATPPAPNVLAGFILLLNIGWFADASGQKSDVLAGSSASKNTKGNWGRYGLYGTLPEAFLVSGNYRRKRIFVSYDSMERNFRFLLGNEFSFPGNENSFPGYCTRSVLHQRRCQPLACRYGIVLVLSSWKNCTGKFRGSLPGN
jgi:hypothetical protein